MMTVRKTESELPPADFAAPAGARVNATDLGQAVTAGNYVLISYLTSPLIPESRNDYVVFALNGASADEYHWAIQDADTNEEIESDDTDEGIFDWTTPDDKEGEYIVSVTIRDSGISPDPVLQLYQSVRPINPGEGLETLFSQELNAAGLSSPFGFIRDLLKRAAYAGEWDSTSELLFELWGYIFDAANATDLYGIPTRLLAAILYEHLLTHPKDFELTRPIRVGPALRSTEIAWAARELNDAEFVPLSTEADNALGVAQIRPETAAMVLGCVGAPWTEKPWNPAERDAVDKQIHDRYLALPESVRIGLFNMLRFPRSNIAVAAKLLARLKNRLHRWPDLQQENLVADTHAVEIIATEYLIGAIAPRGAVDTDAATVVANDFGRAVAKTAVATFIEPFFPAHVTMDVASRFLAEPAMALAYDGLTTFDRAEVHPAVANLRSDLDEHLGIRIGSESPPANLQEFDFTLECAVREFQVYAKIGYVALADPAIPPGPWRTAHLRSYPNLYRYGGPISGVLNLETRRRIQAWRASNWRCPVIVQAITRDTTPAHAFTVITSANNNIWLHNRVTTNVPRMFARDFSRYYQLPGGPSEQGFHVLGQWDENTANTHFNGPVSSLRSHLWNEAEISPRALIHPILDLQDLDPGQRSTYKAIRAVAEVECNGFFDCINCWDRALVSLGPYHWTLGVVRSSAPFTVGAGELCSYLSYLRHVDLKVLHRAVQFFGLRVRLADDWIDANGNPTGERLLKDLRTYAGWIAQQDESLAWNPVPTNEEEANYFKNWHWFYRWIMACRTIDGFRWRMWDMARLRLRDILSTPWGTAGPNGIPNMPDGRGGTRAVTIGDVFTSERTVALVLQWHVLAPNQVITPLAAPASHRADPALRAFLGNAIARNLGLNWRDPGPPARVAPEQWDTPEETALLNEITTRAAAVGGDMLRRITLVNNWPFWAGRAGWNYALPSDPTPATPDQVGDNFVGPLHTTRDSFQLDGVGLPPAPNYVNSTP